MKQLMNALTVRVWLDNAETLMRWAVLAGGVSFAIWWAWTK